MLIRDKVNELLELGYDNDVIALTLKISDSQLEYIKKQIEVDRNKRNTFTKKKTKLQLLRERYGRIYNTKTQFSQEIKEARETLSKEQMEEITKRLDIIEEKMQEVFNMSAVRQKHVISEVIKLYSYMDKLDLPLDVAKRAYTILLGDNAYKIKNREVILSLQEKINQYRTKYINIISYEIENTDDINKLNMLLKMLTPLCKSDSLIAASIQSKINKKIQDLKLSKMGDSLSILEENIEKIIDLLINPDFDIEKINQMIEQNGLEYFEKRKKFIEETVTNKTLAKLQAPTIEGSIRQVIHQIINEIKDGDVEISNIDDLYQRLLALNVNRNVAVNSIVKNLLKRKEFDEAEVFVLSIYDKSKKPTDTKELQLYRIQIRNAHICEFIMKGINAPEGSIEDEDEYYQMIQSGIERAGINPELLVLGNTIDGNKKITWADIMEKTKHDVER